MARRPVRKAELTRRLGRGPRRGGQVLQHLEATREATVYSEVVPLACRSLKIYWG